MMESGWYTNVASILRPPLFDPSVPLDKLAQWIDANTMDVHYKLKLNLEQITKSNEGKEWQFRLPDGNEYWECIKALSGRF